MSGAEKKGLDFSTEYTKKMCSVYCGVVLSVNCVFFACSTHSIYKVSFTFGYFILKLFFSTSNILFFKVG